jgi:endoglucanase
MIATTTRWTDSVLLHRFRSSLGRADRAGQSLRWPWSRLVLDIVVLMAGLIGASGAGLAQQTDASEWDTYRAAFVAADGRVIDTGNHGISHSEGQGWGLLFAETFDDRTTFDKIWSWTRDTLQHRDNALFSWKWDPRQRTPIGDRNDAADGDIAIAWALARAGQRWHSPSYTSAATRIVAEIRRRLFSVVRDKPILLPGRSGFRRGNKTVVNLSYYVYPAFQSFARIDAAAAWRRLAGEGLQLLTEARFGRWGLPPDWLELGSDGTVAPAANLPPRFGFDAVRIPLYLVWAGAATPQRLAPYLDFWNQFVTRPIPAWVNLNDNAAAPFGGSTGLDAVAQLVRSFSVRNPAPLPAIRTGDDYYSASLTLLAQIASRESLRLRNSASCRDVSCRSPE